jgi:transcriptional regulator with XRE-family HTH domain
MKKIDQENVELGKRLRAARRAKNLTIEEVASAIGVAPSTYREWEAGRAISGNPYAQLATVLEVGVYHILGIEDKAKDSLSSCLLELEKSIQRLKGLI